MAMVTFFMWAGTKWGKLHQQRQLISLSDWWEHCLGLQLQKKGSAKWCTILKPSENSPFVSHSVAGDIA